MCAMLKNPLNRLNRRRESPDKLRERELMLEYVRLTERLEQIRANYDFVSESSEIDALIYEENAVLCRLSALLQKAKETGVHIEFHERRGG